MMLYANGCSMTAGDELGGEEYDHSNQFTRDIDPDYKERHAWPRQLANFLNMDCYNHGSPGASNDNIIRTTLEWTSDYLKNNGSQELFVVIGWSSVNRIEFRINDGWYPMLNHWAPPSKHHKKIHKFYNSYLYDETFDRYRSLINIISLQSWFKVNRVPYLFFNALNMAYPTNIESKSMLDMVDAKHYLKFPDILYNMTHNCRGYPIGPRKHPLAEGHEHWAIILFEYIKEHSLTEVTE